MRSPNPTVTELPADVQASDLAYPKSDWEHPENSEHIGYKEQKELGLEPEVLQMTFYRTKSLGWVLCTLHISNPGKRSSATTARTYGIGVGDHKLYTVGKGPHVDKEIRVYLKKDNLERLAKYVELWRQGMADAGTVRDRISTRRAQGQMHRAAGRSSWSW